MSARERLGAACATLPHTTRAMFGGLAFAAPNGAVFAAIMKDDVPILKFAPNTSARADFLAAGGAPWMGAGGHDPLAAKVGLRIPPEILNDAQRLASWAARAHRAAGDQERPRPKKKAARR